MYLIFERADGGITISEPRVEVASVELFAEYVKSKHPKLAGATFRGTTETPPADRTFRDAWHWNDRVDVNMPVARQIHMDRIRKVRNAELAKVDNEVKVAEDANRQGDLATARAKRQALRDIPQTFDLSGATTPEELDALWPSILPRS